MVFDFIEKQKHKKTQNEPGKQKQISVFVNIASSNITGTKWRKRGYVIYPTSRIKLVSSWGDAIWAQLYPKNEEFDPSISTHICGGFNPFLANVPILNLLKAPENQRFSGIFRGYKTRTLASNGLIWMSLANLSKIEFVIATWRT